MSDGGPSLEEASPLEDAEARAFLPGTPMSRSIPGAAAMGSPMRLRARGALESALLIGEAKREVAFKDMRSDYTQTDNEKSCSADLRAMSVLSMYGDTISIDMNTERDNESVASARLADQIPCCAMLAEPEGTPTFRRSSAAIELTQQNSIPGRNVQRNPSLFFHDGIRSVDFVLVWESGLKSSQPSHSVRRDVFEQGLRQEGLHIEREPPHGQLNFVKIHAPHNVLKRYSEILKLRMPMNELPGLRKVHTRTNSLLDSIHGCFDRILNEIRVDPRVFPEKSHRFTAIYSRDKEYLFDLEAPRFWSGAICSRIVQFVLDRQRFSLDRSDNFAFGVDKLIADEVYTDAYPLHDGDLRTPGSMRNLLYTEWASVSKCFRYQPLDYVKDYFGVKIALYFAWLGFYTYMLLLAALVGLACFIYSVATLYDNQPSKDICNDNSEVMMCPLCDYWCDYWHLNETCLHSRVTYLFDNPTTVFFAIFMSLWAALFLELWKRYSADITHRWDLTGFDVHEEHPRPQYLARLSHVKKKKMNVMTNTLEPRAPFWRMRLPGTVLSFSAVLLLVSLALAAVLAVVLYRVSILAALSVQGDSVITSYAMLFTTATAASINLCLICVFTWLYTWLAEKLTERELLRTQTEFDDSLTLKIYLLQFVNYYASIFYIAFFKGKFVGRPGDYTKFFGYRQEECGPGGCLTELCIQLSIIMIGKQIVNAVLEIAMPAMYRWYNSAKTWKHTKQTSVKSTLQWVKDFKLVEWGPRGLFGEYLEMVLQYGFITIFVAAFPLAPLFALLNNILEMRLDAMKLLRLHRRPVPLRVRDIGVWYRILESIGKFSIITNGFIIAFTSEFIPRLVYRFIHSPDGSLKGYLAHSLALFNVTQLESGSAPHFTTYNLTICRYLDYRQGPLENGSYEPSATYWHILVARLAFIVVFENFVTVVMIMVRWMIPDMSSELRDRIRRETYVINEIIINRERQRAGPISPNPLNAGDLAGTEADWDHLLSRSHSGSEFDLVAHSAHYPGNHEPVDVL